MPAGADLAVITEESLEIIRAAKKYGNHTSLEDSQQYFFGETDHTEFNQKVRDELGLYEQMGFSGYANHLYSDGKISQHLRDQFLLLESGINSVLATDPDSTTMLAFFSSKILEVENTPLCESDKMLFKNMMSILKGTTSFFYKHNLKGVVEQRDCDKPEFLLKAACALFAVAVLAIIITIIAALIPPLGPATLSVSVGGNEVISELLKKKWLGIQTGNYVVSSAGVLFVTKLFDIFTFSFWYDECCKWDNEINCDPPMGMYYYAHGCNNYEYVVYGPGSYQITTWGANTNAMPENIITPTAHLRDVTIPNFQAETIVTAVTTCTNNEGTTTFDIVSNETTHGNTSAALAPTMTFTSAPPLNPAKDVNYDLIVGFTPAFRDDLHEYWWDQTWSTGYTITQGQGQAPYYWNIKFNSFGSGTYTIKLNVRNKCTGQVSVVTKAFQL